MNPVRSHSQPHSRRGAASVLAVAVFGTAAAVVASLGMFTAMDLSRLRTERDDLQQQQYELAAIAAAGAQLKSDQRADGPLPFPPEIGQATIRWQAGDAGALHGTLTFNGHGTRLVFAQREQRWELIQSEPVP